MELLRTGLGSTASGLCPGGEGYCATCLGYGAPGLADYSLLSGRPRRKGAKDEAILVRQTSQNIPPESNLRGLEPMNTTAGKPTRLRVEEISQTRLSIRHTSDLSTRGHLGWLLMS